ncbi:MAG: type II secretion system minor pseudopilin GspK [Gammaproteobacteria bacterium]|nr:type II secretion system minor pseudopilin GspK [Gammaproteobacteria bacterium]
MTGLARQKGVAIITALLIVAIATTVSITISTRLQLDVRRTGNMIAGDQAYLYTLAAESWSQRILRDDRQDNETDHLGEDWAIELPPIPVDGGYILGKLTDMQSCFNLNNLLDADADTSLSRARLERLLANLGIDKDYVQGIIDWIDNDLQTTIPDGAEDVYYMNLDRPYRTANTRMLSASELRLIKGFEDTEVYNTLLPPVCAFGVNTPINVNTASAEVLRSLADDLTDSEVEKIIEQRSETAFNNINEFTSFNDLKDKISSTEGLSVDTEYFMLTTESTIGQVRVISYSLIQRTSDAGTTVIARSQGVY